MRQRDEREVATTILMEIDKGLEALEAVQLLRTSLEKIFNLGYTRPKRVNGRRWGIRTNDQSEVILIARNALAATEPSASVDSDTHGAGQ